MRYWCYNEQDETQNDGFRVVTVSEDDIKRTYYPYWYGKMCEKFGKDHVDATYTFEDCRDDFVVVNWAWESKGE
jgi:hypothetical protein